MGMIKARLGTPMNEVEMLGGMLCSLSTYEGSAWDGDLDSERLSSRWFVDLRISVQEGMKAIKIWRIKRTP